MSNYTFDDNNALILAAEDFELDKFTQYHYFTGHDLRCLSKLKAHGPVLLRGARGSGKSALMIEASLQLYPHTQESNAIGIYVSLRNLALLRSQGIKYENLLCSLIIDATNKLLDDEDHHINEDALDTTALQTELTNLASSLGKRILILFDDAAHIGRETSLNEFFDIFRTLSSSIISCKASIYPGVTKFGTRFDVYNDATVIDVVRNESANDFSEIFLEIINKRFSTLFDNVSFSRELSESKVSAFLGRAVLGNLRAFLFACSSLSEVTEQERKIELSHISESLKTLAQNYYWPLIEEIQPKLGIYEPMVEPAKEIAEVIFRKVGKSQERTVIILREITQNIGKPLEILEYTGFISRREVSRAMKSGGRGSRYAVNMCTLLEYIEQGRISQELFVKWIGNVDNSIEFHRGSELFSINLPKPMEGHDLGILSREISILRKSRSYPYGLTDAKIELLENHGITTVEALATSSDEDLLSMDSIGAATIKRFRSTVNQAIWM